MPHAKENLYVGFQAQQFQGKMQIHKTAAHRQICSRTEPKNKTFREPGS